MSNDKNIGKGLHKFKNDLLNSIANPVFIKDSEHKWILFNDSFCSMLHMEKEELLFKSDYDFFPKKEADVFWKKDNLVLQTGKTNINEEELTNKKGEKHTILTSKVRIEDDEGNFYILGTITDISEMKLDEILLEKKNLQINAQKNEIQHVVNDLHNHTEQNLHIIRNLIEVLTNRIDEDKSSKLLRHLSNWLNSMILVHHFFTESTHASRISLPEYLNQLSSRIPNIEDNINLLISGEPVVLSMRYLAPVGLIITELLQTSLIQDKKNEVRIEINYDGENLDIQFNSLFPLIDQKDINGDDFGLWDLLDVLTGQINAEANLSNDRSKIHIRVSDLKVLKRGIIN